ncbi:hypothetical protein N431DRAFT_61028 [Stipitochalara longipes BDJ]|nr:hypothetical protein N431DRAFT_61028 [Stipitochalara longipes BDJ]
MLCSRLGGSGGHAVMKDLGKPFISLVMKNSSKMIMILIKGNNNAIIFHRHGICVPFSVVHS